MKSLGLVLAAVAVLGACSFSPSGTGPNTHQCADKVMRSENTNRPVQGLWNCLSPTLQATLKKYVALGLAQSADDAVFTDGTMARPPVVGSQFIGEHAGIQVYSVTLQRQSGELVTISATFWIVNGKVDNFAIGTPAIIPVPG